MKTRKKIIIISLLFIWALMFNACGVDNKGEDKFKTVIIGDQKWMDENLSVTTFRNGDPIPEAKTLEDWYAAKDKKSPIWCYYDFNQKNGNIYGKLYNWYAVNDPRGIAPEGWHVASKDDWNELIKYVGGFETAAAKLKLSGTELWEVSDCQIQNAFGFSAIPGGYVTSDIEIHIEGSFLIGRVGHWWCSDEENKYMAVAYGMRAYNTYSTGHEVEQFSGVKYSSKSIRIVKDDNKTEYQITEGESVYTKIMTYKGCECNDECSSGFVDKHGNTYNFGNPSTKDIKFNCDMDWDGNKHDELLGRMFEITFKKYSEDDISILKISLIQK